MTSRAFGSQLGVASSSSAAALLAEAAVGSWRLRSQGALEAARYAAASVGLWVVPCLALSVLLALLLAALLDEEGAGSALRWRWAQREQRRLLLIALLLPAPFAAFVFAVTRASFAFRNLELAAALVALSALSALSLLAALAFVVWRAVRRTGARWLLPLALLLNGAGAVWLLVEIQSGLAQLDARLLAAPLGFSGAFVVCDSSPWVRRWGRKAAGAGAAVALSAWAAFLIAGPRSVALLSTQGAWSPHLIGALRALSDVDRDGYSSWLGGGDCAPFDGDVHPGAAEIVGDGIDNNCIGGDAGQAWRPRRPSWGAQAHGAPTNQNVVIVTIDTLRWDHASFVRAERDTTPQLRALSSESLVFERMYSSAPLTRLALASLFSSYTPSEIDWLPQAPKKRMRRIGPKTPWLPELLRARGYETIAVLTDFAAFTEREGAGFDRGFQHYDVSTRLVYQGGTMWGFPAAEQVDKAIAYVERARKPFLLWLHLLEPHFRYEQPPGAPQFGSDDQARYDAEIWHVDRELGRLFQALRRLDVWDATLLLVTGDHGEAFGEHGDRWHGSNLHDPQLRTAALLRVPGAVGKRVQDPVTFTDFAPTLARLLGDRQAFEQLRGRSLTPLLHRKHLPEGMNGFFAETFSVGDGHDYQAAAIDLPLKLIYVEDGQRFSLFDLERDPGERRPLDPASDPRAAPLLQSLVAYLESTRPGSLGKAAPKR